MARGITSATVVPTASDDNGEAAQSRHSHVSMSDEEEGGIYSSEEQDTNIPVLPVVALQSKEHLSPVNSDQASTAQQTSTDYLSAAFAGQQATAPSIVSESEATNPQQLTRTIADGQQKSIPPLIGKSLRQRSQSAVIQKQSGAELTKNYLELVRDFRQLRPFTRLPDGKYPADTLCVYCVNARPTSVFFPCQHMCVCNSCISLNNISTDYSSAGDWCACPVCMADIRLILPHSGKEEQKYWKWVLEIKPSLPANFKQEFKEAGRRMNKDATPTPTRGRRSSIVTMLRREPAPPDEAPKQPLPKPKVPVLGRRHSWQPGEVANVQNVAVSNEQEEAHNCSIL
ncbi:unnamed protein product [Phytophthora fragariaefolia]|uniref:Unnamed protein product n=1 Tax=Phytophthora fragariaefolia TaxID=1490495 RepID=A0A9W6Y5Q8_9STRA|nr:unnamed protein product [Phytophthora fragariaefolia]